jgi:hypothetical protein
MIEGVRKLVTGWASLAKKYEIPKIEQDLKAPAIEYAK